MTSHVINVSLLKKCFVEEGPTTMETSSTTESVSRIRYGLISRGKIILCDCHLDSGNYESPSQSALERACSESQTRHSFDLDGENISIHVYISNEMCYLCVTNRMFERSVAFDCLFAMERELHRAGLQEKAKFAPPYGLRSQFHNWMETTLTKFSSSDKLSKLEDHVEHVTDIMKSNIQKVAGRGETLDELQGRSESLALYSSDFRQNATRLNHKLLWSNIRRWVIIGTILGIIGFVIVVIILIVLYSQGVFDKH